MKVLFDHNVPGPLQRFFKGHEVRLADQLGWAKLKNGELLQAAEGAGFDVLLSGDKTIRYEQKMEGRRIALVYLSDNHWPIREDYIPAIVQAVEGTKPGEARYKSLQNDLLIDANNGIVGPGHTSVGLICQSVGQNAAIGCGDVRVRRVCSLDRWVSG